MCLRVLGGGGWADATDQRMHGCTVFIIAHLSPSLLSRFYDAHRRDSCFSLATFTLAFQQILPHQAQARQEAEAKPSHPPVDSLEDWQHHSVRMARVCVCVVVANLWFPHDLLVCCAFPCPSYRYNAKRRHWRRTKLNL